MGKHSREPEYGRSDIDVSSSAFHPRLNQTLTPKQTLQRPSEQEMYTGRSRPDRHRLTPVSRLSSPRVPGAWPASTSTPALQTMFSAQKHDTHTVPRSRTFQTFGLFKKFGYFIPSPSIVYQHFTFARRYFAPRRIRAVFYRDPENGPHKARLVDEGPGPTPSERACRIESRKRQQDFQTPSRRMPCAWPEQTSPSPPSPLDTRFSFAENTYFSGSPMDIDDPLVYNTASASFMAPVKRDVYRHNATPASPTTPVKRFLLRQKRTMEPARPRPIERLLDRVSDTSPSPLQASVANASNASPSLPRASVANASNASSSPLQASVANALNASPPLPRASIANASNASSSLPRASIANASNASPSLPRASVANASNASSSPLQASVANASNASSSLPRASIANASNASSSSLQASVANASNASSSSLRASVANASNASSSSLQASVANASNASSSSLRASVANASNASSSPLQASVANASNASSSPLQASAVHTLNTSSAPLQISIGHASIAASPVHNQLSGSLAKARARVQREFRTQYGSPSLSRVSSPASPTANRKRSASAGPPGPGRLKKMSTTQQKEHIEAEANAKTIAEKTSASQAHSESNTAVITSTNACRNDTSFLPDAEDNKKVHFPNFVHCKTFFRDTPIVQFQDTFDENIKESSPMKAPASTAHSLSNYAEDTSDDTNQNLTDGNNDAAADGNPSNQSTSVNLEDDPFHSIFKDLLTGTLAFGLSSASDTDEPDAKQSKLAETKSDGSPSIDAQAKDLELSQSMVSMALKQPSKQPSKQPPRPLVTPLTDEEREQLLRTCDRTDQGRQRDAKIGNVLTAHDFSTLLPRMFNGDLRAWLNDNIVNEYLAILINEVKRKDGYVHKRDGPAPRVHAFSSQWFQSMNRNPQAVKRWAARRQLDGEQFLDASLVFFPICDEAHWRLVAVKPKQRTIVYCDSLGHDGTTYTSLVKSYLREVLEGAWDEDQWVVRSKKTSEKQKNASDCGVFTVLNALVLLRGEGPERVVSTEGMEAARLRIAATLLAGTPTTELA